MATPLSVLADEIGVDERTLRRAVDQGTLHGRRPSPRTLDLPLSERQYARRSWRLLGTLREALRTERNVRFALLFGSAARGGDTPDSDLDLLVDLRDPSLERVLDLADRLSARTGRAADVVRLADAEADPAFLASALAHGRVLVDRERLWPRLSRRAAGLEREGAAREARRARAALAGVDRLLAGQRDG